MTTSPPLACPNCGTRSAGKFCAECGAAMLGVQCGACRASITPGARFCHQCGAPVGASGGSTPAARTDDASAQPRSLLPWAIGLVSVLAVVIAVAVQQRDEAPQAASGNIALDGGGGAAPFAGGAEGGAMRAPDISSMTPRERADRLYDRVMRQAAEGKADSAVFFAGMAAQAYELLGPLDDDLKYDYGRMAEMSGNLPLAQQQADAILKTNPNHLLGLILAARVAQLRNDEAAQRRHYDKLVAAEPAERAKNLEEYTRHKGDIDAALQEAKAKK